MSRFVTAGVAFLALAGAKAFAADTPDLKLAAKKAIAKAVPLIEKSSAEYRFQRQCFSCHHQTLPLMAMDEVKRRGFQVDQKNFQAQIVRTAKHLRRNKDRFVSGRGPGGRVDSAGYSLWALAIGDYDPDEFTAAVTEYLLATDKGESHWGGTRSRAPSQASDVARTVVALRGLETFATKEQRKQVSRRRKRVHRWLLQVKTADTEDKAFQLQGLADLGEEGITLALYATDLILDQRSDGGWGQRPGMKSDAYATGTALVALHRAGVDVTDPVYRRGVEYLLKEQLEDGSWRVKTRSRPIQRYFESGFPHGKDQFISMAATCWATTALALTLPAKE